MDCQFRRRTPTESLSPRSGSKHRKKIIKIYTEPLRDVNTLMVQNETDVIHETSKSKHVHEDECLPKHSKEIVDRYSKHKNIVSRLSSPMKVRKDEKHPGYQRMDWNNYHRLDVIHSFLDDLEYDYPSICTTGVIGQSLEGRDLKEIGSYFLSDLVLVPVIAGSQVKTSLIKTSMLQAACYKRKLYQKSKILKISNSNSSNASVWMDAGIHAREWIAPAVATYIADYIAKNFNTVPDSITNKDWYFLPVVNPDGYEFSCTKERLWRKNRAWHSGRCVGVDLNRNFSFGWGGKGSSDVPTNAFYRGPEPFSEPESSAIRDILMNAGISFKVYITLHSYGQVIIFPFAYRDELCPGYIRLLEGATVMSKAIYECNGNTYKVGISRDVMYGAAGTSNDWSYGAAGIPYCYLIELRSKQHKFKLPKEEIQETGNEILSCIKALMEFVDKTPLNDDRY